MLLVALALRGGDNRSTGIVKTADLKCFGGGLEIEDRTTFFCFSAILFFVFEEDVVNVGGTERGYSGKFLLGAIGKCALRVLCVIQGSNANGIAQANGEVGAARTAAKYLGKGQLARRDGVFIFHADKTPGDKNEDPGGDGDEREQGHDDFRRDAQDY